MPASLYAAESTHDLLAARASLRRDSAARISRLDPDAAAPKTAYAPLTSLQGMHAQARDTVQPGFHAGDLSLWKGGPTCLHTTGWRPIARPLPR
jgi:hypothetical protein